MAASLAFPSGSAGTQAPPGGADAFYALGRSSLGGFLVAAGGRGVRAILLGGDLQALVAELQRRLPGATLAESALAALVARVGAPA
jgi:hypothetical protein